MRTILLIWISLFSFSKAFGQMTQGVITYERTINLFKIYTNPNSQKWIGEKNKYRKDEYELHFNDSTSVFFASKETEFNNWTASCNSVTNYYTSNKTESIIVFNREEILVSDSLIHRSWKITDKWRKIADYDCRQAVFTIDDSTRIYAWFTTAVMPNIGPESYWDLPGAILGLATEDGSVTYFAKSVVSKPFDAINTKQKFNTRKAKTREEHLERFLKNASNDKERANYKKNIFLW